AAGHAAAGRCRTAGATRPRQQHGRADRCWRVAPARSKAPPQAVCRGRASSVERHVEPRGDSREHGTMNIVNIARRIDQRTALWFGGGDLAKPFAQPLMKSMVQPLETIGAARAS